MKSKVIKALMGIILAVLILAFTTALGLAVVHITGFPYSADIDYLNIQESSGLGKEEIISNYNAVMDFLRPFNKESFELPTLAFSEMGAFHFEQCRTVFNGFYLVGAISLLLLILLFAFKKALVRQSLKVSGYLTLAIPAFLGIAIALNFEKTFILFHKVFFEGTTWIFDPSVDEIINILPAEFFMHCAVFIAIFWVAAAVLQLAFAYSKNNKNSVLD